MPSACRWVGRNGQDHFPERALTDGFFEVNRDFYYIHNILGQGCDLSSPSTDVT